MAKLFTITLPARAKGEEIDYTASYEDIKRSMRSSLGCSSACAPSPSPSSA